MLGESLVVVGLMCELMGAPEKASLSTAQPRFSWTLQDTSGTSQAAYRVLVASAPELLEDGKVDMWDSGITSSAQSLHVPYAGKPLAPKSQYWWRAQVWDACGGTGVSSEVRWFRTGELQDGKRQVSGYPLEVSPVEPVSFSRLGPGHYFIDFGRAAFGTVQIQLTCAEDNRQVEVHLGEMREGANRVCRKPPASIRYRAALQSLQEGTHTYRVAIPPDKRNTGPMAVRMPADIGEVLPFRYCELVNCPEPLEAGQVRQLAVHYPFDDKASRFSSSNPALNQVWDLCKYSIRATSFCGLYVDGDRERIPYEADAYINQLCHYCVDHEFTMARRTHEYLMVNPTWPTEWILHSVLMAWADYEYTGDASCLADWYSDLQAKTLEALAREDGLIGTTDDRLTTAVMDSVHFTADRRRLTGAKTLKDIVDWPPANFATRSAGERDGYDMVPVNTVVNAFHYRALTLMEKIAGVLGKSADARHYREQSAKVRESFNRVFLDANRGIYRDGEGTTHTSLHANMFALAFGLVPEARRSDVVAFIKSRGMACSVCGAQYLLEALYSAGEGQEALDLMTSSSDRSWLNMIRCGSTITMEAWDLKYKGNLDWNHAWGAAPANIIARFLMGIRPLEPGFGKVLIQPQPGDLDSAEIVHPTIRGPVSARFRRTSGTFSLEIEIPGNVTARVAVPCASGTGAVELDGKRVNARREDGFLVLEDVSSGHHRLSCTTQP